MILVKRKLFVEGGTQSFVEVNICEWCLSFIQLKTSISIYNWFRLLRSQLYVLGLIGNLLNTVLHCRKYIVRSYANF